MDTNVLIVEDCPVIRLVIRRTLNLCGIEFGEIVEADNGKDALKEIEQNKFGLIIADLNMPVMSGSEMLAHIKLNKNIKKTAILIVSAESNSNRIDVVSGLSSDFLHKPFSTESLRNKVLKLLKKETITIPEHRLATECEY